MKILAIETSTMLGGIAIVDDSQGLIAEMRLNVKSTHSERLMTGAEHVLKQSGLAISDIDAFAVSIGPGSFTGLRIGLSTVKGFSYATGKPIVSVPTLEALAWNFSHCRYPVCTMLDARKKEVYAALFLWENQDFRRLIDELSIKVERLLEMNNENLKGLSDKILFTGEGSLLYKDKILKIMGDKAIFASSEKAVPSPASVAYLGMKKAVKGEFSEPISLVPFYIRKSEAEIKQDARNTNSTNAAA
jgi:tRNA threonylcarbamoyladenosine biosynthesis protein TsaB